VSGGLDSDVLVCELAKKYRSVYPVYIRQGLIWEKVELYWLRRFLSSFRRKPHVVTAVKTGAQSVDWIPACAGMTALGVFCQGDRIMPLTILSLPMTDLYGAHWSTGGGAVPDRRSRDAAVYLPGRNLALSVKAAVFCALNKIPALAIGSLDHNPFPDASPHFFKSWGGALGEGLGRPLKIQAPYRRRSKADVIRRGRQYPIELSFSCIAPQKKFHCGRCNKCAERKKAFRKAGVEDKTKYAQR